MSRFAAMMLTLIVIVPASAQDAKPRPLQINDLFRFKRLSDPQISPDGKWVVYVQGVVDFEANRATKNLWLASTAAAGADKPKQLTATTKGDSHPRWSPDGKHILFESNRSGTNQLWIIAVDGGEAKQLTTISTGAGTGIWSRDGKHIAFVSAVWPEYSTMPFSESDALNKKRMDDQEKDPVKAKVFTRLFFRHWDEYVEDKRQHLFVMDVTKDANGLPSMGSPRDVTPGDRDAYPTSDTFSTGDNFTFSPDGKYLVFTAVPVKNEAWSTNYDICRVPVTGGNSTWECLTAKNLAADGGPSFSPDGKKLVWRAQRRAGFEADRWELKVCNCDAGGRLIGSPTSLGDKVDLSFDSYLWLRDSATLLATAEEQATTPVWELHLDGGVSKLVAGGTNSSLSVSADGNRMAFTNAALAHPATARIMGTAGGAKADVLTINPNAELLDELKFPRPESVTVPGAGGTPMQMWILKPPGFDAAKKWPLAFLVHGGPQGAWEDGWSYRWNPQAWAAQGYVVALPNPRGSTGFGQKYVDEISGDWGGKCYDDLMAGLAYLEKQPWIDSERMAAAGASFGGYMMNWFAVNTGKFKTLITHCGVWNFESMYALTEELWFDEWEHGGPPWGKNRHSYEQHSPHRLAANLGKFKTPMLIIHNDLDFRVPVAEGLQLFTTLQRQGVPARFLNFPDEGHWVLKPRNSQRWHREVFTWLTKHVPPGGQ
jgi:dipeptidyl aminopeptidase/acylaminoacyl peptidase